MRLTRRRFRLMLVGAMVVCCFLEIQAQMMFFPAERIEAPAAVVYDTVKGITLPLSPERSLYNVVVTDGLARVEVTQMYVSRIRNVNDMVYVFPLPHDGSVHAMSMQHRDRIYQARIYEKKRAAELYDSAKAEGSQAALLVQDKPNIFQQRIANIPLGDTAFVKIQLIMPLKFNDGMYEFRLPTRVARRYGGEAGMPAPGEDPWNPAENEDGHRLHINVLIQTGYPIAKLQSPSHPLVISELTAARPELERRGVIEENDPVEMPYASTALLQQSETYPNRDYVLRFRRDAAGRDFSFASFYDGEREEGYFAMQLFPGDSLFSGDRPDLELILLVDISGSQGGWPLQKEKEIALDILSRLKAQDRLSICAFSNSTSWAFGAGSVVEATADNLQKGRTFISSLNAGGGTELLSAVQQVLAVPKPSEHERFFVFLTDGFIGNESAIFETIQEHPTNPTIFTFGAGNNLNHHFLEQAARVGNGYATPVTHSEAVEPLVSAAWNKIESPALKNVSIDFGTLGAGDVIVPNGTNLYAGSPFPAYGRYSQGGEYSVTIRGFRRGQPVTINRTISFAQAENTNSMLPQVWARQAIGELRMEEGTTLSNKERIIELSTEYQVLSKYTAFLALNAVSVDEAGSISDSFREATPVRDASLPPDVTSISLRLNNGRLLIDLPAGARITGMAIYDLRGRLVFRFDGSDAGRFTWDGIMAGGARMRPGRYVVVIHTSVGILKRTIAWR